MSDTNTPRTNRYPAPHFTEILKSDYSLSMRTLFIIPLVLMSLMSFPSWGLSMDDLVYRSGLYYEKFTATPFTGEVDEGLERGSYKNGKREGSWEFYHSNGQLQFKGDIRNGKEDGSWVRFYDDGQLYSKGSYKQGKQNGDWEVYWNNGKLKFKGRVKLNRREGSWEGYHEDGTVDEQWTGTFKNGVKVSD